MTHYNQGSIQDFEVVRLSGYATPLVNTLITTRMLSECMFVASNGRRGQ